MTVTLDGINFDVDDFTGADGLGHTETQAATTGGVSGASYPAEALFPNRIFRAMLNQLAIDNATTSATSHDISTGSKTFTLAAAILNVAEFVIIAETAAPSNYLYGQVTSVSGNDATVNVTNAVGTGTGITAWSVIGGAGIQGQSGADGADGADGLGLPAPTASGYGQIAVQNNTDDGYEFLPQGADGQVLQSAGSDALPTFVLPVSKDTSLIPGAVSDGDYLIGMINSNVTITEVSGICTTGAGTVTLYLSTDKTSASGTAITGGALSISTTVDRNALTANNTVVEDTPRFVVAAVSSASALEDVALEFSYTKKVDD